MQLGALRDMDADDTTFVGPHPAERTARGFFLAPVAAQPEPLDDNEEKTSPATPILPSGSITYVEGDSSPAVFTADMIEILRRKLREAEAREEALASGIRTKIVDGDDGVELDVEVDVEAPRTLDELDEVLNPLPELEIALAPNSDSNFYAGFDDTHPDGVFFATYEHFEVGAPVFATVLLPAGFRFRAAAIVEWIREPSEELRPGVGLKLCGLDARAWGLIASFVRNRRPIFYVG